MATLTDSPVTPAASLPVPRKTAMEFLAAGRTAAGIRALAAVPPAVERYAALLKVTPGVVRAELAALADGIDAVTAEGLTAGKAAAA